MLKTAKMLLSMTAGGLFFQSCMDMSEMGKENMKVVRAMNNIGSEADSMSRKFPGQDVDFMPVAVLLSDNMVKSDMAKAHATNVQNYVSNHYVAVVTDGGGKPVEAYKRNIYHNNILCPVLSGSKLRDFRNDKEAFCGWHIELFRKDGAVKTMIAESTGPWEAADPNSIMQLMNTKPE